MMGTCRLPSEIQQPIKIKLVQVCTKVQTLGLALSQRGDSPFVYRDGTGWPASLPYIWKIRVSVAIGTQSGIHLHTYGQNIGVLKNWITEKLLKL